MPSLQQQTTIKGRLLTPHVPTTVKNENLIQKRREQIVLAAIKLFSQKGFHRTTLRELAEEAGLSHGNIYDYVGSKEDIFFLLHEYMVELVDSALSQSVANVIDPVEKLRRMVRSEFNVMYEWADAILIIYQESHILKKSPLMKEFLHTEREHLARFERVLEECSRTGACGSIQPRTVANLIKIMADSWVLKRWDLRGHVTQLEMESSILDLVLYGLFQRENLPQMTRYGASPLSGKLAFIVNSETLIGNEVSSFLLSKGASVVKWAVGQKATRRISIAGPDYGAAKSLVLTEKQSNLINGNLFKLISKKFGPIDFVIHDIGIGHSSISQAGDKKTSEELEANLRLAQSVSIPLKIEMQKKGGGKIIYLAPWAWDRFADPIGYQTVKAAVIALTRTLAKSFAPFKTNVNCIVPGFISGTKPLDLERAKESDLAGQIPLGCLGEMADVLETVLFFLSDSAKYLTGQVVAVAGGVME